MAAAALPACGLLLLHGLCPGVKDSAILLLLDRFHLFAQLDVSRGPPLQGQAVYHGVPGGHGRVLDQVESTDVLRKSSVLVCYETRVSLVISLVSGAVGRASRGLEREDLGSLLVGDLHRERSAVIAAQTLGTVAVGPVDSWLGRVVGRR
jgi:hypothetical protein